MSGRSSSSNRKNNFVLTLLLILIVQLILFIGFATIITKEDGVESCKNITTINNNNEYDKTMTMPLLIQQYSNINNDDNNDDDTDICAGYDGVLRIRSGDEGAAAGTVFFIYVVNQLLYADLYNLMPWIHMDNTSKHIYDFSIHHNNTIKFETILGEIPTKVEEESKIYTPKDDTIYHLYIPQSPKPLPEHYSEVAKEYTIEGNGVWESYFQPVSRFSPHNNRICKNKKKLLYELEYNQLVLGIHGDSVPWGAVRAWTYGYFEKEGQKELTIREWYRDMRRKAAVIVRKYIRPQPWLLLRASQQLQEEECSIGMHIRETDKTLSGGRLRIGINLYLDQLLKLVVKPIYKIGSNFDEYHMKKQYKDTIFYVATDSSKVIDEIMETWPTYIVDRIRTQSSAIRSNSSEAVFVTAAHTHHRTNTEVLVDIYTMSQCSILLHGRSAVSEAVFYTNPDVESIDLDMDVSLTIRQEMQWF